ncbi:hypothetical protein VULLAG_LOCUS11963 [Vulpes lagopus]
MRAKNRLERATAVSLNQNRLSGTERLPIHHLDEVFGQ